MQCNKSWHVLDEMKILLLSLSNSCKIGCEWFTTGSLGLCEEVNRLGREKVTEWIAKTSEKKYTSLRRREVPCVSELVQIFFNWTICVNCGFWVMMMPNLLIRVATEVSLLHLDQLQHKHTHRHTPWQCLALQVFGLVTNIHSLFSSRAH